MPRQAVKDAAQKIQNLIDAVCEPIQSGATGSNPVTGAIPTSRARKTK